MALPPESFAVRVSVALAADTVPLDVVTTEVSGEIVPAVTAIVGNVVPTALPLTVAWIVVAVPASWPVNVAVYVPLAWSTTEPIIPVLVPPDALNTTVAPPVVRLLVTAPGAGGVGVAPAPAAIVALETVPPDVAADPAPAVAVTVNVSGLSA